MFLLSMFGFLFNGISIFIVDQGAIAKIWYTAFPNPPASLEPHHQIVQSYIQDTRLWEVYSSAEVHYVFSTVPNDWGRLYICRGLRHTSTSVLDMALNRMTVSRQSLSFGECRWPLHCHHSQVHWGVKWYYLIGSYL